MMCRLVELIALSHVVLAALLVLCPLTCGSSTNSTASLPKCYGEFDVYFILDKSSSVPKYNFQKETVNFVESIINSFKSFKSGTSFITFSDRNKAEVVMELTRDRDKIAQGLKDLRKVEPLGMTYLAGGIKKANDQIVRLGQRRARIVIIVTDGRVYDINESVRQATQSQSLGSSVISVGVGAYVLSQLKDLASKPPEEFVFTSKKFDTLPDLISKIVEKSCIEILSASPTEVCIGVPYNVTLLGEGFNKTNDINKVICSYSFNDTYRVVQKPSIVEHNRLVCPGFMVNETDRTIILQMSVNEGITFVSSNVTITSKFCPIPTAPTTTPEAEKRVPATRVNVGLALFLVALLLFLLAFLLWWFSPLICKKKPKPPKYKKAPPVPPPPEIKPEPGKKKWPTVDASYYGGGGVGGIAPVRVDWGDKGSTEAGSKLAKAKGAKSKEAEEDEEKLTGGGSAGSGKGGGAGAGSPGCMAATKARIASAMAGCVAAMSRGYQRIASYRPRPGGNPLYSSPAHA